MNEVKLKIISISYKKRSNLYSVIYEDHRGYYMVKYPAALLPSEEKSFLRIAKHRNETPYSITWC